MKHFIKIISINISFLFVLIELISFILMKTNTIPDGLPPNIILNAHEKYGHWHPVNSKFKIATKCWKSEVEFNNLGLKNTKDIDFQKTKKRIAILGDSMTENAQLDNNKDFKFKLQKLLPEFEVINFSVSSIGLADHIKIYDKLVSKFNVDYVFVYLTYNDFSDNHISKSRPSRISYKVENNKIEKIVKDTEGYFKDYNSKWNLFKREKLIYVKKYSNSYKLYWFIKQKIIGYEVQKKVIKKKVIDDFFDDKKKIFKFLVQQADDKIFSKVPTLIFINSNNFDFLGENKDIEAMKEVLKDHNLYDPKKEFINYLKENNLMKKPYLGFSCDAHYSELGAKLLSEFSFKKFNEFLNKS